jgi:hypothetical protein
VFPLTALAEGKNATALALVRTGSGEPPPATIRPTELKAPLAGYGLLHAAPSARLAARTPDVTYRLKLTGGMARYDWGINGQAFDMSRPGALQFLMAQGQRVRIVFANATTMYHPMHIHGHTFQLGPAGPRKRHRDRATRAASGLRLRRWQPRPVDDALPQPLPRPPRRHDGHAQLPGLGHLGSSDFESCPEVCEGVANTTVGTLGAGHYLRAGRSGAEPPWSAGQVAARPSPARQPPASASSRYLLSLMPENNVVDRGYTVDRGVQSAPDQPHNPNPPH